MEQHPIARATRRTVLAGIAATLAPSLAARAQQRDGVRRIGVLMSSLANDPEEQANAAALVQGLGALNWREGGNLRTDWRWAGGDAMLFDRYAAELVALGPEVLLVVGTAAVEAMRRHTGTIAIVFTSVFDPVAQGFVESLARPGGKITGFSSYDPPMVGKWLGMLAQIKPPVVRVAVLFNPAATPYSGPLLRAIEEAAPSFAMAVRAAPCHDDAEIEAMTTGLAHEERSGLLVLPDAFTIAHRNTIIARAAGHRLPAVYPFSFFAANGGLMSYGVRPK